jgi:hypothetical protein
VTFCHPVANCFHRCLKNTTVAVAVNDHKGDQVAATAPKSELSTSAEAGSQVSGSDAAREEGNTSSSSTSSSTGPRASTPEGKDSRNGAARSDQEEAPGYSYISSFMIGVSFKKGSKFADLQPAIQARSKCFRPWYYYNEHTEVIHSLSINSGI